MNVVVLCITLKDFAWKDQRVQHAMLAIKNVGCVYTCGNKILHCQVSCYTK